MSMNINSNYSQFYRGMDKWIQSLLDYAERGEIL